MSRSRVLQEAALTKPKINSDLLTLFGGRRHMEEDPALDEGVIELLRMHHLQEAVDIIVDALTDRPE